MSNQGICMGVEPETLRVILATGADFTCTLRLNEPWPAGTSLALVFDGGSSWPATIADTDAVFHVDKATADTMVKGTGVKLVYTNGTTDQVWAIGGVVRRG